MKSSNIKKLLSLICFCLKSEDYKTLKQGLQDSIYALTHSCRFEYYIFFFRFKLQLYVDERAITRTCNASIRIYVYFTFIYLVYGKKAKRSLKHEQVNLWTVVYTEVTNSTPALTSNPSKAPSADTQAEPNNANL